MHYSGFYSPTAVTKFQEELPQQRGLIQGWENFAVSPFFSEMVQDMGIVSFSLCPL